MGRRELQAGYLGFVAHEFRNPLTTALWCTELLGRLSAEDRAGARGQKLAALALRSLRRVSTLVEDHLLAERLAVDGIPLRREPVRVAEVVAAIAEKAPPAGGLATEVSPELTLETDPWLFPQILEALLAAAGRDGAAVRVGAQADGEGLRIRVTGAPQPADALELPQKGSGFAGSARPIGLAMATAAARALGLDLALEDDGFALGCGAGEGTAP